MLPDPFTTENGDVILRVGPDDTFCVHKLVLSLASPVFKDLFQTAQPDQPDGGQEGLLPTIPITDLPESVDLLLRFIYPGVVPPTIADPSVLSALLTIADKYNVQTVSSIAKERLADAEVLDEDPFGVYLVARRWGFADEAKGAAKRVTLANIAKSPFSKDPQNLAEEDFLRLLWFMQKRGDEAKKEIRTYLVTWNDDPDQGYLSCGGHVDDGARKFFETLAEEVVKEFDVNPCLDGKRMVMALMRAPDPPHTGFCEDIDPRLEPTDFRIYCPLRPSTMVGSLNRLAAVLGNICERYLGVAMDGNFPA